MCVRDNEPNGYGINNFRDNEDGTITDLSTGLMRTADEMKHVVQAIFMTRS